MADSEEPALKAERLFEQLRRFTDTWVTNTSHHVRRLITRGLSDNEDYIRYSHSLLTVKFLPTI